MKENASSVVAVIGDVVGSRQHASRRTVQRELVSSLNQVNERVEASQLLEPTIGDEFQGVYPALGDALHATLLMRLVMSEGLDVRFGLGVGTLKVIGESAYGLTQDGPAWWAARAAVEQVEADQKRLPTLRTRVHCAAELNDVESGDGPAGTSTVNTARSVDMVNAYLLCRDQIVTGFDARERRIALGVLDGHTLAAIAETEGISASAVSQRYRRGINVLIASAREVTS